MSLLARCSMLSVVLASTVAAGCSREASFVSGGDAERGRQVIADYACGVCHVIPGVVGARGVLAPPLDDFGLRSFIGGQIPNTPANLVRWVRNAPEMAPQTAMPALGITEQQAHDVAAYLYALR